MALGLALVTLLSRWPYRARMLYNWDAVQFALALREFDVAKHQPHPPGYLLYVGLGRLFNASLGDPTLPRPERVVLVSPAIAILASGRSLAAPAGSACSIATVPSTSRGQDSGCSKRLPHTNCC